MQCLQCSSEAPAEQRFCGQCGARLPVACSACGASNPDDFKYCGRCGTSLGTPQPKPVAEARSYTPPHLAAKILTARSALEGERKQVTVLFADLAGSTALAERLDPEEMHDIMDRCFRLLVDEVHRYEGTVNQFTGDGIMALFGAPIAHENACERAVRAALGMQAALRRFAEELRATRGIEFAMRIGLNTGPVVVGRIGDDLRMDYTAVGDTTNLAARLQGAAAPGTVLVSEHTAKLVAGRFALRPVGPLVLKGKREPVPASEVLRALPRTPLVAPSECGLTPLVGRRVELAALETFYGHAAAGHGQVVFVAGEAGIGKSRLIHEFRRALGADVRWLDGRCVSFSREIPLLPVADVVKASFGIEEVDDEATMGEKVRQGLAALPPDVRATEPYLRSVLALDPGDPALGAMEASARRFATFDALKRYTVALAAERPLVLLIEDLHWIDQASDEYLNYVVDGLAAAPILLLCTHRPGYRAPFAERSYSTRLALQPLSAADTARMASAMAGGGTLPPAVRDLVAAKAEGNPFFAEEVTKSLLETGALVRTADGLALGRPLAEIEIPDTVQDVIMARIDRLGEDPKRAIQIASVIGREFALRLLQRASDLGPGVERLVGELRALELVYERSGVPELAYMFKHALTHEVAYESMLVQRRKALHRLIGRAIEELYVGRLPEYWETLAHHFHRGEDWPRAFEYLVKAGDKARASYANGEAVGFYARALEAATHVDVPAPARTALLAGKGRSHLCLSEFPEAIEAYRGALALATDVRDRARIESALGEALLWAHEFDAAVAAAEHALELVPPTVDAALACRGKGVLGFVHLVRGELDVGRICMGEARALAERAGERAVAAESQVFLALVANWTGEYREALADMDPVVGMLKDARELLTFLAVSSHYSITIGGAGDYRRALAVSDEAIALGASIGDKVWRARQWNTRGWMLGELGAFAAAEEANRRSIELAKALGSFKMAPELIGNAEANLADAALWRGDLAGAEPHLAGVAAILADRRNEWMAWRYGMHYRVTAAELAVVRGDLGRAREHLAACLATAERTRSRRYLVRATRLLAGCHAAAGDHATAEGLLAGVVAEARALGNPPQLWHALLAHGRSLLALGRRAEAAACAAEALALAERVAATLPDELRAAFAGSPVRRSLAELHALSI